MQVSVSTIKKHKRKAFNNAFLRIKSKSGLELSSYVQQLECPVKYAKRHTSFVAGVFSIMFAVLVVWLWQIASSAGQSRVSSAPASDIYNNSSIRSDSDNQPGTQIQSTNNGTNITVQKSGNGPATVTVNGQTVPLPNSGTVHKQVGDSNIDINIQHDNGTAGSSSSTSVNSHSSTSVSSNSSINNWSYTSGGSIIHN